MEKHEVVSPLGLEVVKAAGTRDAWIRWKAKQSASSGTACSRATCRSRSSAACSGNDTPI